MALKRSLGLALGFFCCAIPAFGAIDFSAWELQEPDDTVVTSSQLVTGYSDAYFYLAADGGQVLMDPQAGTPTSGSAHPRTELREMSNGSPAAWAPTGANTLSVSGEVLLLGDGASGKTTIGQVFDSTQSIPLCELIYSASLGGFEVLYEEAKGAGTYINLNVPVSLNSAFSYGLSLSDNVLTVTINGATAYTQAPSASVLADSFYFKCGDYDQTATSGTLSTVPYTEVELTSIVVNHGSGTPSATPTATASWSSTATVSPTATFSPLASAPASGLPDVLRAWPAPNPGPRQISVQLSAPADIVQVRAYSPSMMMIASFALHGLKQGWNTFPIPGASLAALKHGIQFWLVSASNSRGTGKTTIVSALLP
jgi:hypothetical protein